MFKTQKSVVYNKGIIKKRIKVMEDLRRDRKRLMRTILALAWPTMLEQFLQTIVIYINTAMIGAIGQEASAAVGITSTTTWLLSGPLYALGIAATANIARAIGENNRDHIKSYISQSFQIGLVLSIVVTVLTLALSPVLPGLLGAEEAIQKDASVYFALINLPYSLNMITIVFGAILRGSGDTRTPMMVNLVLNIIHVILNFFFIYPSRTITFLGLSLEMFGFGWGVFGAALSTAISYAVGGIMMFIAFRKNSVLFSRDDKLFIKDKEARNSILKMAVPLTLSRLISAGGHVVFTSLVAGLGTTVFAAHSIALTAEEAFYIPGFGMQSAAISLTGHAVGERNRDELKKITRMLAFISVSLMVITGGLLFIFSREMMTLFISDADVIALGSSALKIVAVSEPIFGLAIIMEGIFNGAGDTRHPLIFSTLTMWLVRILGTWLCINVFSLGLNAVWLCMVGDNSIRGLLLFILFARTDLLELSEKKKKTPLAEAS